jgi:hypothetical protein
VVVVAIGVVGGDVVVVVVGVVVVVVVGVVVVVVVGVVVVVVVVVVVGTTGTEIVTVDAECVEVGPVFSAASVTLFALRLKITVPSEVHATSTWMTVPDDAAGVTTQPVAVPVRVKSLLARPLMLFEKV